MIDSWYSARAYHAPIIRSDTIKVFLPCEKSLFEAKSAPQWMALVGEGRSSYMASIEITLYNSQLPQHHGMKDPFAMYGLLASIRLRVSEAYFRLFSGDMDPAVAQGFVPWKTYASDSQARLAVPMVVEVIQKYGTTLSSMNMNCMVLWHNICLMLTANLRMFDIGAGCEGAEPARKALDDIAIWATKPAARRALIHATQTFKVVTERRASDGIMFHTITSLFTSAIILGLYVLKMPLETESPNPHTADYLDLRDNVDWKAIGDEGLVESDYGGTMPENPVVRFIRFGGNISISGVPIRSGYLSARRLLLDNISLMEDIEKWRIGRFSHVLRIMSDSMG